MKQKHKQHEPLSSIILSLFYIYILLMLIIAWTPGDKLPDNLTNNFTTSFHFLEFVGLSVLSLLFCFIKINDRKILMFFSIGFIMAIITEIGQIFIPGRAYALTDLLINISGFLIVPAILTIAFETLIYYLIMEKTK
jgi:VanZ family protein